MPKWIQPVERRTVSFMASRDLYDKFLGLVFCVVVNCEKCSGGSIGIEADFNGKSKDNICITSDGSIWDPDHNLLRYFPPSYVWKAVDFGQIDGSYAQFSLTLRGGDHVVKKWGIRIICEQLEDDLKVEIRDNQLIDRALLYEVGYDSTYSEAENSHKHEDGPIEIDLLQYFGYDSTYSEAESLLDSTYSAVESSRKHEDGPIEIELLQNFCHDSTYLEAKNSLDSTYSKAESSRQHEDGPIEIDLLQNFGYDSTYSEAESSRRSD